MELLFTPPAIIATISEFFNFCILVLQIMLKQRLKRACDSKSKFKIGMNVLKQLYLIYQVNFIKEKWDFLSRCKQII
jgi:hypothetical protein